MTVETVWAAYTIDNEYGRHGGLIGVFRERAHAVAAAEGKGFWGAAGGVQERKALEHGGRLYLLDFNLPYGMALEDVGVDLPGLQNQKLEAAKQRAAEVLTPEERDLLGLKP